MQLNDDILETYEEFKEQEQQQKATMEEEEEEEDDDNEEMEANSDDHHDLDSKYPTDARATKEETEKAPVFDSNAWYTWSQSLFNRDRDSSPFRGKNFDLLLLLSTQESVHRVLKYYQSDSSVRPETYAWLLDFYKDHVNQHFDGHQSFGSADRFLEKMLRSPPTMIENSNTKASGVLAWVNPVHIAEDIARERSEVALAWMQIVKSAQDEHTDLRRLLFTNSFSKDKTGPTATDTIIGPVANSGDIASNSTFLPAFE
jgi:hypothetical protein